MRRQWQFGKRQNQPKLFTYRILLIANAATLSYIRSEMNDCMRTVNELLRCAYGEGEWPICPIAGQDRKLLAWCSHAWGGMVSAIDLSQVAWRRSARCDTVNAGCVEVAMHEDFVAVRDSKDPGGPALVFTRLEWQVFVDAVTSGELA